MRTRWITMTAISGMALAGCWQAGASAPEGLEEPIARQSYGMGALVGSQLSQDITGVDRAAFVRGLSDAMEGRELALDAPELTAAVADYEAGRQAAFEEQIQAVAEENANSGKAFRDAFATEDGVTTLASGLQYRVLKEGEGENPAPDATVRVHYRGSLIDGTEFDSSYAQGEPVQFPLARVIPGFSEALSRMSVGSKWKVVVPPELAYGEQGAGPHIEPNSTLVFEIELIEVG
ncbi:MAG: FKBP-type peptidyl-prolyl cis-trans isomerase [Myxococcota bacterium]|nr:FKBP-type peptidyl-prolyl cis-trans isomerase [bacterium]MDP6075304.1 FKBP-type peptidyl-prolyl cis-trans isomerase [Myxococcota bacterium]MDP7074897.1 FKBP-type peptidyl-prolyl cis-trans isomerase [Myxococcota bacterium]MDP7299034.1 FKBP-type peptidyl-prolyl cis-trans isomerase [Myxococcota bacterium]MDP7432889.1 FKBP-type peptidyl-prolyl cis-trans isomerase [Myxococcota bacterium]